MSPIEHLLRWQKKHRLVSHVAFWAGMLLLGVSNSKYHDGKDFTWWFAFTGNGLFLVVQLMAAYFTTYVIIPALFYRRQYLKATLGFIFGVYVICVIARFLIVRIAEPLAGLRQEAFETNWEIITNIPKLFYNYFFSVYSYVFVFILVNLLIRQLYIQERTLTLEKEKIETELKLLKSQLNPHFLFNTLNNIYTLSLLNSPVTSSAIAKLSEILDYILYRCEGTLVPIGEEIKLLNNYLELEKLRYDDRLQLHFHSHIAEEVSIPPLLLLSLAENAFKHGASQDMGRPFVGIDLEADGNQVSYRVVNSLPDADRPNNFGKIGLGNLRKQLEILYPDRHNLTTVFKGRQFHASIVLDLKKKSYDRQMPVSG